MKFPSVIRLLSSCFLDVSNSFSFADSLRTLRFAGLRSRSSIVATISLDTDSPFNSPVSSLNYSLQLSCPLLIDSLTPGFRHMVLKILRPSSICTTAVSFSTKINLKIPSHRLVLVLHTRTGDPYGISQSICDLAISFGTPGCRTANAMRLLASHPC